MAVVLTTVVDVFILTSLTSLGQGQSGFPAEVVCWVLGGRVSALPLGCPDPGAAVPPPFNSAQHTPVLRDLRSPADWGVGAQEPDPSLPCNLELPRG